MDYIWLLFYDDLNDFERHIHLISTHRTKEGAEAYKKMVQWKYPTKTTQNFPIKKWKILD